MNTTIFEFSGLTISVYRRSLQDHLEDKGEMMLEWPRYRGLSDHLINFFEN